MNSKNGRISLSFEATDLQVGPIESYGPTARNGMVRDEGGPFSGDEGS